MLRPEGLHAQRADGRLVGGEVVRLEVLARVAAVRGYLAAERALDLPGPRRLRVPPRQLVQVTSVTHDYLA